MFYLLKKSLHFAPSGGGEARSKSKSKSN